MIRAATPEDIPRLVEMIARFICESDYRRHVGVDPDRLTTLMESLITHDLGAVFVYERDARLVGLIGMTCYEHPISAETMASEMFWWVEPDARGNGVRLLKRAERWAHEVGATRMQMVAPTSDVATLYERLGYERLETAYQRSL